MSIRKRNWKNSKGDIRTGWVADLIIDGKRVHKQFKLKRDAAAWDAKVRAGTHKITWGSITIADAAQLWLQDCETRRLETSTLEAYHLHVRDYINPALGDVRLHDISIPEIRQFETDLQASGRSAATHKKTLVLLGGIFAHAVELGYADRNPVRDTRRRKQAHQKRHETRLAVGIAHSGALWALNPDDCGQSFRFIVGSESGHCGQYVDKDDQHLWVI